MRMFKHFKLLIQSLVIILLVSMLMPLTAMAKDDDDEDDEYYYKNKETGYEAYIIDDDEWLTDSDKEKLIKQMRGITEFCNVVFYADETNTSGYESHSENQCVKTMHRLFGEDEPAVIYLMDDYYDYIASQGSARSVITSAKARSITDNIYRYSDNDDTLNIAAEVAFEQIEDLFNGRKIAEPMKYICNAFIAIFVALIANYLIVNSKSKLKKASVNDMIMGSVNNMGIYDVSVTHIRTDRRYSPRSSSSGGGYGGGHGGGGHHGGGHSGGGHAH